MKDFRIWCALFFLNSFCVGMNFFSNSPLKYFSMAISIGAACLMYSCIAKYVLRLKDEIQYFKDCATFLTVKNKESE